jgi:hypothetical protein
VSGKTGVRGRRKEKNKGEEKVSGEEEKKRCQDPFIDPKRVLTPF